MADTRLIGVGKENRSLIRQSSGLMPYQKTDISLLTLLNYHDDRTDIEYRPN